MTLSLAERHRLAVLGWVATVATSLSMFTAFEEKRYVVVGAALSGLLVGLGISMRHLHVPTLLVPVVQLLVAAEVLLVTYGHHTVFRVIPTSATLSGIGDALSAGMDVAQRYAAPVPPNSGLMLITVGFIAIIAIAVDLLAAGLARAPVAGLALLALYSVPVASLPDGVPALGFVPGAAAYMSLLMVSERERLAHWGRHVARSTTGGRAEAVDTSGLVDSGRRISFYAITAAVVLPILVPTFTNTLWRGEGGIGNGGSDLSFANPLVSLANSLHRKDPVDLVQVTNSTPTPAYLRLAVLDEPGANAWRNSGIDLSATVPVGTVLPPPIGLDASVVRQSASMSVLLTGNFPRDSVWLPVPSDLTSVTLGGFPGEFAFVPSDQTVTSLDGDSLSHVSSYFASYLLTAPTAAQLQNATPAPADVVSRFGTVPPGVPLGVGEAARAVSANATTDYERALALQSFFRDSSSFTYDLEAGYGSGYRAMSAFLEKRRGYCQHFAATMAIMARELGIPSRVVVGLLAPTRSSGDGTFMFTSHDAHAWPELYFGGVGWVRFEPTPGNGASPPPYTHQVSVPPFTPTQPTRTTPSGGGAGGRVTDEPTRTSEAPTAQGGGGGTTGGGVPPIGWLVLVAVVVLAMAPGSVRWGIGRSRMARAIDGGPSSEYAWLELRDRVIDLRLPWTGSLTPRARSRFVEPLLGGDPDGTAALDRLSLTVERARYASSPLPDANPAEDAREIMAAIGRGTDRKRRLTAFLWPASLMPEVRLTVARWRSRLARPEPQP